MMANDDAMAMTTAPADADWQALPTRAASLFMLGHAALFALPLALGLLVLVTALGVRMPLATGGVGLLLGIAGGAWYGRKVHRSTFWRLDTDGFALRRGRLWQRETRVPASRVQHLDLRHGPLERHWRLATLVVHTAGSRFSTVTVTGLDAADAERLRDRLARQLDDDDDA
jgi:uncharacterized protein